MTNTEKAIAATLDSDHVLYKYHNSPDYDDDVPDIVDYLYDLRDKQEELVRQLSLDNYKTGFSANKSYKVDNARDTLKGINACIKTMEESDDIYFIVEKNSFYIPHTPAVPVPCKRYELAVAKVNASREITWERTGKYVTGYSVKLNTISGHEYIYTEVDEMDGRQIDTGTFHSVEPYYLYEKVAVKSNVKYISCPDCGYVWTLTPTEEKRFKDLNLCVPKRCIWCRRRRRIDRGE